MLSAASLVGFLPYALFGPVIGVLVDRRDRKLIMIGADLAIACGPLRTTFPSFRGCFCAKADGIRGTCPAKPSSGAMDNDGTLFTVSF